MVKTRMTGARAKNAPQLRGLLIAPRTTLEHAETETQRIVNFLHPEVLLGEVTATDVLDCVQANTFDVIWFLGHSGPTGIELSDGVLSPAHLAQILRQSPPQLVVLNSCSSLHIAMQIHDDLQAAVICTVLDVPDLDAYITGAGLASALAQGMSITDAYNASRPSSNRQYVLLNGSVRLNGTDDFDDLHRLILRSYADLQREIAEMRRDVAAVREEQTRVRAEMIAQVDYYQPSKTRLHLAAWAAGFTVFVCTGLLLLKDVRDLLGLTWWVAFGFSAIFYGLAFGLFAFGLRFRLDK